MTLLQTSKYIYSMLWFNSSLYFIFIVLSAIPFRVYRLKCIYNVKEWKFGIIPLAGDMAYNIYNVKVRTLFIVSTMCYILSVGMCSWLLLIFGIVVGGYAEYIIASEELNLKNKIVYAFRPVYRYYICYKEICNVVNKESLKAGSSDKKIVNSSIRKDTLIR